MITGHIASYRLPLALTLLVLLLGWEVAQPYFASFTRGPGSLKRRSLNAAFNLGLGLLNAVVVAGVFVGVWALTAAWTGSHGFGLLNQLTVIEGWRWLSAMVLLDAWTYTWHRLNHRWPFLWRFHRLHHSDREMNVTTANRFHLVEIVLSSSLRVPLLVLSGVRIEELALYETALFAVVQFHHANIGLPERLDRILRWVIVTPALHKVHHSVDRAEADSNYSSLFSWWDRWFGTWKILPADRRIEFGVED